MKAVLLSVVAVLVMAFSVQPAVAEVPTTICFGDVIGDTSGCDTWLDAYVALESKPTLDYPRFFPNPACDFGCNPIGVNLTTTHPLRIKARDTGGYDSQRIAMLWGWQQRSNGAAHWDSAGWWWSWVRYDGSFAQGGYDAGCGCYPATWNARDMRINSASLGFGVDFTGDDSVRLILAVAWYSQSTGRLTPDCA
jgi:hypothetical protein